ncbi:MAG: hypothetical protein ACYC4L_10550 [Chloroflexota bacterium]
MDEMEKYIAHQSVFWTYAYMVAFLAVWNAYSLWNGMPAEVPQILFATQFFLQISIRSVLNRRIAGGDEK